MILPGYIAAFFFFGLAAGFCWSFYHDVLRDGR